MDDLEMLITDLGEGMGYMAPGLREKLIAYLKRLQAGIAACESYRAPESVYPHSAYNAAQNILDALRGEKP